MSDIVRKLREKASDDCTVIWPLVGSEWVKSRNAVMLEAAAEIEKLQRALSLYDNFEARVEGLKAG